MLSSRKIININISSSSEDDHHENKSSYANITDEKKRKRMISNRESAKRSRMKKEQHIKDLNDQVTYFRTKSNEVLTKINQIVPNLMAIESENRMLRMQGEELKKRLDLLEKMLASYQSASSYLCDDHVGNNNNNNNAGDEFNVMDILQEPWLQPCFQSQTVDGIYQF